jgi:hypothetical protein
MSDIWICDLFNECRKFCYHIKPHEAHESCNGSCNRHETEIESNCCKYMTKLEYEMKKIIKEK